jgi:hypothetical protein
MVYIISRFLILIMGGSNAEGGSIVAGDRKSDGRPENDDADRWHDHRACDLQRRLWPNILWRERPRHWPRAN